MKILYCTDGSTEAGAALSLLMRLTKKDEATITVFTVAPPPPHSLVTPSATQEFREAFARQADSRTRRAADDLAKEGFSADSSFAEGHPGREITQRAEEEGYDLVVVGAGEKSWLTRRLLGSVSTYVTHNCRTSVLVVHEFQGAGERLVILLGTDGSPGATQAIDLVAQLADPHKVRVEVRSAVPPFPLNLTHGGAFEYPQPPSGEDRAAHRDLLKKATGFAEEARARLAQADFEVRGEMIEGASTDTLLREAEACGAQLLAVGSRGLGPVRRALLGSVSDHLARLGPAALIARSKSEKAVDH